MTWPTKTDFVDGDVLTAAQVNNIGTNLNEADPTGITDGYVLTADGAGGMGWESVPSGAYTVIASGSLSGSQLSLTSIPQTYKHLWLACLGMNFSTTNNWYLRTNSSGTGNYIRQGLFNTSANCNTGTGWQVDAGDWSGSNRQNLQAQFMDYTSTDKHPNVQWWTNSANTAPQGFSIGNGNKYGALAATTSIYLLSASGATFTAGTYVLYGVN